MATTYTTTKGKTVTEAWIEPVFLALTLPIFLGVKVVAAASPEPLYSSDSEFRESVILDGVASFWNLLELPTSLRLQKIPKALEELFTANSNVEAWRGIKNTLPYALDRLFIACGLHMENRGSRLDPRWQAFNSTVREIATDVLNVFVLANEGLRRNKRDRPTSEEVQRYWKYAQLWAKGDQHMKESLSLIEQLVDEYRKFYRVNVSESSHAILLPLSIAMDNILSIPNQIELKDVILEGAGQIQKALERREIYRPILMDKSTGLDYHTRLAQEFSAIKTFMITCVDKLFVETYKKDRALLQENRNRIKSGAEFTYRWLALQEKQSRSSKTEFDNPSSEGEAS
jgi:CRISPR-associated protein Csc3